MRRLEFAEFNLPMLRYFQLALNRYSIRHNRIYVFLGEVSAPDILVILADFFLRAGEISWTIVGGVYEGRLVVFYTYECDLGDGWEDAAVHGDSEPTRLKALQMGSNILQYVFTTK